MPESLLSRFDLIFIVLDENDEKTNHLVSEKVTNNHRFHKGDKTLYHRVTGGRVERELIEEREG